MKYPFPGELAFHWKGQLTRSGAKLSPTHKQAFNIKVENFHIP